MTLQTQLEGSPKHGVPVSFEGYLALGTALLSNTIQRNHPLQHFTCGECLEGGGQEARRRINCTVKCVSVLLHHKGLY